MIRNSRGSALIEAALTVVLLGSTISSVLLIGMVAAERLWLDHVLYESLICAAEDKAVTRCERHARSQIDDGPGVGRLETLRIKGKDPDWEGFLEWTWGNGDKLLLRRTIRIPGGAAPGSP